VSKYIIRQPDKADREFGTSQEALAYFVRNPGFAKLYHEGELLMTKGFSPFRHEHDQSDFRGVFRAIAEA
jgi:hypothetical protein